jgi:predicted TIM-barrel fold metal-dependent hydrolase
MARQFGKAFSIHFAQSVQEPPADLLARAHEVLLGIASSLQGIPARRALWREMRTGIAELNLAGWRFEYRVDRRERRILVVDVQRADG